MRNKAFVFDTVSLANFLLTDAAYVLKSRYSGRAFITGQVLDELTSGMRTRPRLKSIGALLAEKHFSLISMTAPEHSRYSGLIDNLGRGEASSLAVALSRGWTAVTDDRAARSQCTGMGIMVTGTVGILKAACIEKQITPSDADHILSKMAEKGFYSPVGRISDLL